MPLQTMLHRSWPMELVPKMNSSLGGMFISIMPVSGSLLMRVAGRCPGRWGCTMVKSRMAASSTRRVTATRFLKNMRKVEPQ